jgi:hypothetical protein
MTTPLSADLARRISYYYKGLDERDVAIREACDAIATFEHTAIDTAELEALRRDAARYRELATPEIADFLVAVEREALHQRDRWGSEHDAGKTDADWFWLIGYLAGKAINNPEKLLHHIITTAAACLNWHAARLGTHTAMRPGIADPNAALAQQAGEKS